jgi:hypothetical protein
LFGSLRGRPDVDQGRAAGHRAERFVRGQPSQPDARSGQDLLNGARALRLAHHHAGFDHVLAPSVRCATSPAWVSS